MASKNVKVTEVSQVNGKLTVFGTVGEVPFEASPFQWGSKMLMKVEAEGLDRGSRIAVGHAAKRALDRKSTRLNSSHVSESRMPSSA